jgi:phosphosulfolactate synthase
MTFSLGYSSRSEKPRRRGRTAIIDTGLPLGLFTDMVRTHYPHIDAVKFGWTTGLLTKALPHKIEALRELQIDCWLGGTFFKLAWGENKLGDYLTWLKQLGVAQIEISDGTITLPLAERARRSRTSAADSP